MNKLTGNEVLKLLNDGQLNPYQFYNLDVSYDQYYSTKYYIENLNDTIEKVQNLNILFFDIECYTQNSGIFPKADQAKFPINAVTLFSTKERIFRSYILLSHVNVNKFPSKIELPELIDRYKKELIEAGYITDEDIKIEIFSSELDLIKAVWDRIHIIDPAVLSSWNGDVFDLPYFYFRLANLFNKNEQEVKNIMSKFGDVKVRKMGENITINIPELPLLDLMYLYKPRDEGGLILAHSKLL